MQDGVIVQRTCPRSAHCFVRGLYLSSPHFALFESVRGGWNTLHAVTEQILFIRDIFQLTADFRAGYWICPNSAPIPTTVPFARGLSRSPHLRSTAGTPL